jgi:iron complex outermembrane recepter protein
MKTLESCKRAPARKLPAFVATLMLTASASTIAAAQTASPTTSAVDDIVVTAQRRSERAIDVPISLTTFSGEQLNNAGVSSTLDLARITPGLNIGQNSGEGDFVFISLRGVAMRDFADTNESPSAVYLNEFYKANLMGLDSQIYDMDRVEVLRGPQGTLYGRNATGGLINYVANAPTDTVEGYASALVAERNRYKVEGAVGGPVTDQLSGRLSVYHHEFDGYTKNIFPGGEDGNALNASSVRGQLLYKPTERIEASLFLQYYDNDNEAGNFFSHKSVRQDPVTGLSVDNAGGADSFGYVDPAGDPRNTDSNEYAYLKAHQFTAIGKLTYKFDTFDVISITGYEKGSKDARFDSDSTPNPRATQVHPDAEQFSQEIRAQGETGALNWVTGLYYFDYSVDGNQSRKTSAAVGFRNPVLYSLDTTSWSAFANLDYKLTESLTATAGLRYTNDRKTYDLRNTDTGLTFNTSTVGDLAKRDDNNTSGSIRLSWKPDQNSLIYGGISQGFKAGTFNVGYTNIATAAISVKPETLTDYEVGAKTRLFDGKVDVSGAAFFYDYKNSQAYQFDGKTLASTTFNRDATIAGAELEVFARPWQGLAIRGSVTHLDGTLKDVQLPGLTTIGPVVDRQLPLTPDWAANLEGRYTWPAWFGGDFAVQGNVSYKSSQFFDAFNSPSHHEDGYTTADLRASWTDASQKLTFAIFAENVTDTEYRTYSFDLSFLGQATSVWGRPRWVGAEVSYNF